MDLILRPASTTPVPQLGTKRSADSLEPSDASSSSKKLKSTNGKEKAEEDPMKHIKWFLGDRGNEVRLSGKTCTLKAFDCGGEVRRIKGAKSIVAARWIAWSGWFASPLAVSQALRTARDADGNSSSISFDTAIGPSSK